MSGSADDGAAGVAARGRRAIAIGGDNYGPAITGNNIQVTVLGLLSEIRNVPPAAGPVGVPGVKVFVGRGAELAALHGALRGEGTVVVQAVAGLGGIGKSTLVARYALGQSAQYSQVLWVTADTQAGLKAGLADFALALEPQLARTVPLEGLVERALGWLASHAGWLLVLDNVADPRLVRDLLPRLGSGRVVVTSRLSVGWAGIAQPLALDVLDSEAARDLVALTVGASHAGLLVGVEELCERLGFLPLGVEQAAAFMAQNRVSAAGYLALLDAEPGGVFADAAEGWPAESTLARVWAVSLDALAGEPLCGQVLRVLAWLSPDGVPRSLLAGLGEARAVVRAAGRLTAYSMLAEDDTGMITVHRLVQAVLRTAQEGDTHREPVLVERARDAAARLLHAAIPGAWDDPRCWPAWRALVAHVAAYAECAPARTDIQDTALLLDRAGCFLHGQGSATQAIAHLRRAAADRERILGADHPDTLDTSNNLATAYYAAGQYKQAIELYERNLADIERAPSGAENPHTLSTRNNLANAYLAAGQHRQAIEMHERTLPDRERVLGADHPDTLDTSNNLANAYYAAGQYEQAVELHERTLTNRERTLDPDHPDILQSRHNLANAHRRSGQHARAANLHEGTLADMERILGPEHPDTLIARNNLANALQEAGQCAQAAELHERTLADMERVLGSEHPETLNARNNLAVAYMGDGQVDRAAELFERTMIDMERVLGPEHPATLYCYNNLGEAYFGTGQVDRAAELFERTMIDMERLLGPEHPATLYCRNNLHLARAARSGGGPAAGIL